ncbi:MULTISPECIES: hypothetical protein [Haloferacaceae]|uniref:Uncharacterized protein n=1 Tax=Halorubrum glutamatedens TaxID=2707018 RepID=A0ABD5QRL8_9EURY|nr:hypothetical protein [Halobellus captivus]
MDFDRYREAVAANRRKHGFDLIDGDVSGLDGLWRTREEDPTVGSVSLFAAVADADDYDPDDVVEVADRFRDEILSRLGERDGTTPIGYVAFAVGSPDDAVVSTATSYTVAERRTNVFPLVYDTNAEELHTHPVPRLKGRGIYRRQSADAERLFDV